MKICCKSIQCFFCEEQKTLAPCLRGTTFGRSRPLLVIFLWGRSCRSVVSNASIWDTLRLVPKGALPEDFVKEREATPQCKSFMHVSGREAEHAYFLGALLQFGHVVGSETSRCFLDVWCSDFSVNRHALAPKPPIIFRVRGGTNF